MLASPRDSLDKTVASLQQRLTGIEEKLATCDDDSLRAALENSASKFRSKLEDARRELAQLTNSAASNPVDLASMQATETALANHSARQQQSPEQQQQAAIERLQKRIAKAQERLDTLSDPVQIDALKTSLANLTQKLADAQSALEKPQP